MRATIIAIVCVVAACTKPNPNRCCTDIADCAAKNIPQSNVCSDGLVCRGNQCIAETCMASSDCESLAPFCVDGLCGPMCTDDTQCPGAAEDPGDRFCVSGTCVACRMGMNDCPTNAPVCDMNACRGCRANAECASGLCDADAGTCFDAAALLYAAPTGGNADPCTQAAPCSLDHAISLAIPNPAKNTIKLAVGSYGTFGTISSGTVVVYGDGPTTLVTAGFNVSGGTLRVRNFAITSTAILAAIPPTQGAPIPTLDIDGVTFMGGQGASSVVYPNPGVVSIRRSSFICDGTCGALLYADGNSSIANYGSHVTIDQSQFIGADPLMQFGLTDISITNSVLANAGPTYGTFQFGTGGHPIGASDVRQSTFYNARVVCPASGATITFDSNVILNAASGAPADSATGATCVHSYDLIKPQSTAVGASNLLNMDPQFMNPAGNDFHLKSTSPAIDKANPASSDSHDLDGTSRPQGAANDIGAYEYH